MLRTSPAHAKRPMSGKWFVQILIRKALGQKSRRVGILIRIHCIALHATIRIDIGRITESCAFWEVIVFEMIVFDKDAKNTCHKKSRKDDEPDSTKGFQRNASLIEAVTRGSRG